MADHQYRILYARDMKLTNVACPNPGLDSATIYITSANTDNPSSLHCFQLCNQEISKRIEYNTF